MNVGLQLLVLFSLAPTAAAACYKHLTCSACIAEVFAGGSCLWYENLERAHPTWSCIAGMVEDAQPQDPAGALIGGAQWGTMTPQGMRNFSALYVDTESEGSCYSTTCTYRGVCPLGFYAVENKPCSTYSSYQEYRLLKCCRLQRLADGYLRGFEVRDGLVRGNLQYVACCLPCMPGHVLVGCDAFNRGTCNLCPQGTYNPSGAIGTTCQTCQPCPAGFERVTCGPSREGRCEPCPTNYYKTRGLEGDYTDKCKSCSDNACDGQLNNCGGASAGRCRRCPTGEFFAGVCRECSACPIDLRGVGCGGSNDRTCVVCGSGLFEGEQLLGRCNACKSCSSDLPTSFSGSFAFSGPSMRIGCGAFAEGECVRLAVALDGVAAGSTHRIPPRCIIGSSESGIYCPGITFKIRWAVEGPPHSYFSMGKSNCSHADGACITGIWRVSLWQRSFVHPHGQENAQLGYFDFEEPTSLLSNGSHTKIATLDPLPLDLLGGAGYFIRLSFEDTGSTCCIDASSTPMYADTDDFEVADVAAAVFAEVQSVDATLVSADASANYEAVEERLRNTCGDGVSAAVGGASAEFAILAACEKLKALKLGMNIGEFGLTPLPLPATGHTTMSRAQEAALPVRRAREALSTWYGLSVDIPTNLLAWKALLAQSTETHAANSSRRLNGMQMVQNNLTILASGVEAAANATRLGWQAQMSDAVQELDQAVKELKELDAAFTDAADALGFSVIRMAQGTADFLWAMYGNSSQYAYAEAVDTLGSLAVMLLGTWRADWLHELTWFFTAQVGEVSDFTFQSFIQDEFGGAQASGEVPLEQSRSRVWVPFLEISAAWLSRLASDNSVDAKHKKAGENMQNVIRCIETVTEKIFEPLSRPGASLLRGALPDIADCGYRGSYLQNVALGAAGMFPGALGVIVRGLGPAAHQPWEEDNSEKLHLLRAAVELKDIFLGRASLFRRIFLQMLDIRDMLPQLQKLQEMSLHARTLMAHVPLMADNAAESGPTSLEAAWRWHDSCSKLLHAVDIGRISAACLSRRNLGRLERLAAWVGASDVSGDADLAWRKPWHPNGSIYDLDMAEWSAMVQIANELSAANIRAFNTGFLRIEASANTQPLLFASLAEKGRTLLNLQDLTGQLRIHREVYAYLIGSAWLAGPGNPTPKPTSDPNGINVPYVELELRHLTGPVGEMVQSDVPMFTRHEHKKCIPLGQDVIAHASEALEPYHGLWMLSARDGATGQRLEIIGDTYLRLLIKVDKPKSEGPWSLLYGPKQYLYRRPSSEDCTELQMLPGLSEITTTSVTTQTTTGTRTTTELVGGIPQFAWSTTTTVTWKLQSGFLVAAESQEIPDNDSSSPAVWIIPIVCLLLIGFCACGIWIRYFPEFGSKHCYRYRKALQLKMRRRNSDDVGTFDSPSPKGNEQISDQLRYRASPKAGAQQQSQDLVRLHGDVLRGLGVAEDALSRTLPQLRQLGREPHEANPDMEDDEADPGSPGTPMENNEEWGPNTDTPRRNAESSDESSGTHSSDEETSEAASSRTKDNHQASSGSRVWSQGPLSQYSQQRTSFGASHFGVPPLQGTTLDIADGPMTAASSSCSGDSRRLLLGSREAAQDLRSASRPPPLDSRGFLQEAAFSEARTPPQEEEALAESLPPGWELRESRSKKGVYYYANPAKGLSQMERPKA